MVDKVRPLKIENPAEGGSQFDYLPTETKPTEDYLSAKGMAFEGMDTFRYEKFYRTLVESFPLLTQNVTYSSGDLTSIEFFNSATQVNANRIARVSVTYTSRLPTTETWIIYQDDGVTTARTITYTYTYSGGFLSGCSRSEA